MGRAVLLVHLGLQAETCSIAAPKPHHAAKLQQDLPYVCATYPRLPASRDDACLAVWLLKFVLKPHPPFKSFDNSSSRSSQQFQDSFGPCFFVHRVSSSGRWSSSSCSRGFFDCLARFKTAIVCSESCTLNSNTPIAEASRKRPWYPAPCCNRGYGCCPPDVSSSLCFFRLHLPAPEVLPLSTQVFIISVFNTILLSFFRSRHRLLPALFFVFCFISPTETHYFIVKMKNLRCFTSVYEYDYVLAVEFTQVSAK